MGERAPLPSSPIGTLLVAAPLAASPVPADLYPGVEPLIVSLDDLRPPSAWHGRLFELLASAPLAVGLVVPVRWLAPGPVPDAIIITDHVNLCLRGPLTGQRPPSGPLAAGPQPFPSMAGRYQPETMVAASRGAGRGRVYSVGAVAGVADLADLTPFERDALAVAACPAVADHLVDAVVIAALYGLKVAACGVPVN